MVKRLIPTFVFGLILAMTMQMFASAGSAIPVDAKDPEFTVDIQQDTGTSAASPNVKENALDGDPSTRWAGRVILSDATSTGSATQDANGGLSVNMVLPLGKVYTLEEINIQFYNNAGREYCLNVFVSNDNKTWTKVELKGDASASTYTHSTSMPTPIDCYQTVPAVNSDTTVSYSQVMNLKLATPTDAKYVKIQGYGYVLNGTAGDWFSICTLELVGTESTGGSSTATTTSSQGSTSASTTQSTTKSTTTSPSTSDVSIIIFVAIAVVSLAGVVIVRKGFSKK